MPERFVDINCARIWLADMGEGDPVMLCNGGPGCCDYLEPVSAMIDDRAHVYRWEQRGCGRSSADGPFDLETTLRDLDGLRETLEYDRWVVGGHSWGSDIALSYALAHPERTRGAILVSGAGFQNDRSWSDAYHAGSDAGLDQVPTFAFPVNLEVNRIGRSSYKAYIRRPRLWREIADLDVPVLIVSGQGDIRPTWPMEQIAALLPRAELHLIDGAGHCPWFTHAGELAVILRSFLTRLKPEAQPPTGIRRYTETRTHDQS